MCLWMSLFVCTTKLHFVYIQGFLLNAAHTSLRIIFISKETSSTSEKGIWKIAVKMCVWSSLKPCINQCCAGFQGCNEFGDHACGPSEEDHEQHTDYESPDAASPRNGRAGVMIRDGPPPSGRKKPRQNFSGAAPEKKPGWQSKWTDICHVWLLLLRPEWNHFFVPQRGMEVRLFKGH